MDHERVKELLSDFIEGELTEEISRQVQDHLEQCDSCRQDLDSLKQTVSVVAHLAPVRAPADFVEKVNLKLRRRLRHRPELRTSWEQKIPYETICLLMLAILAALYIILYLMPLMDVDMSYQEPGKKMEKPVPRRNEPVRPPRSRKPRSESPARSPD